MPPPRKRTPFISASCDVAPRVPETDHASEPEAALMANRPRVPATKRVSVDDSIIGPPPVARTLLFADKSSLHTVAPDVPKSLRTAPPVDTKTSPVLPITGFPYMFEPPKSPENAFGLQICEPVSASKQKIFV